MPRDCKDFELTTPATEGCRVYVNCYIIATDLKEPYFITPQDGMAFLMT